MEEKKLKELILSKGCYNQKENLRIYNKFFKGWFRKHAYIYNRFGIKNHAKILDIGCGFGHNLIHFNPESIGIEANDYLINFGKNLGLNIIKANVEDELPRGLSSGNSPSLDLGAKKAKFDLIWCSDFLVHMISPFRFLFKIRDYLGDNGRLVIQVPKISIFNTYQSKEHFYAFNKKSLTYLLEVSGYKAIKFSGFVRFLPSFLNRIFEPLLQIFGTNIWILVKKDENYKGVPDKTFLPKWF